MANRIASGSGVHQVGVISDTHGLLRPEAVRALQGCELILHAGDVGKQEILERLLTMAPVVAVRGNVDREPWARRLPETQAHQIGKIWIYMLHDPSALDLDPVSAGFNVIVSGHTHRASIEKKNGILYLNPGSAGPRRFNLPVTLARLQIAGETAKAEIVQLLP